MMRALKEEGRKFFKSKPGRRFQEVHERRQEKRGKRQRWKKVALIAAGWALVLVGTLLLAMPGPGLLVVGAGLMLLASESISMARMLDYMDKKTHPYWLRLKQWWKRGERREARGEK